jgi:phospholipid N-methyltransferase
MSYISSIFSTGAVRKTPGRIIARILCEITVKENTCLFEFGAGKGEITEQIIQKKTTGDKKIDYYAFETDKDFASGLNARLPFVHMLNEDAFEFEKMIPEGRKADYIISSMPLSFYTRPRISDLLKKMKSHLNANGKIILLLHAFWLLPFLRKQLPGSAVYSFVTLPPYFLLVFENNGSISIRP